MASKRTRGFEAEVLANSLINLRSKRDLSSFLEDLLTPAEVDDLCRRIGIIRDLLDGKTQRTISRTRNVSISKVSRGANALRASRGGFKKALK